MEPTEAIFVLMQLFAVLAALAAGAYLARSGERAAWARRVYADVARTTWRDGLVPSERKLLDTIAEALGLLKLEAWWIERGARAHPHP